MAAIKEDRYKDALTCAICKNILTDPKVLPCMHAYCLKCLDSLIQSSKPQGGFFNCPECRHECTIPKGGAGEFKVSPTISFLVDAFRDSELAQTPECTICLESHEKHTAAKTTCLDCNKKLCETCHRTHDSLLKGHKVLDLTGDRKLDLQSAMQSIKERTVFCEQHPTKPLELYCKVDKMLLCHLCYAIDHSGHACNDIKKIAEQTMKPIGAVVTQGKEIIGVYDQAIQDTQAYKSKLEKNAEDMMAKINNDMNALIQAIRKKYTDHKEKVVKEKESNVKQVMSHLGHLELQKAIIESQVNKFCTMIEHGHPVEIAGLGEIVTQKSEEWSQNPNTTFGKMMKFQFTDGQLNENEVKFGTLSIEAQQEAEEEYVHKPLCDLIVTKNKLHQGKIWGLVVTPLGDHVVTGYTGSTCIYDGSHKLKKELKNNFCKVALTSKGKLAFSNGNTNTISIYDQNGSYESDINCHGLLALSGIAVNPVGELIVCDRGKSQIYSVDLVTGDSKAQQGTFDEPCNITCTSNNVNIISDCRGCCVRGIAKDGTEVFKYGTGTAGSGDGELNRPYGVCRDKEDYMFVADIRNNRVILLTPQGRFHRNLLTKADGVNRPRAVTIGNDGKLLVGDESGNLFSIQYRK